MRNVLHSQSYIFQKKGVSTVVEIFACWLGGTYCFFLVIVFIAFLFVRKTDHVSNAHGPKVSVVIAARNEESSIAKLLESLEKQDYQGYEIILVDDHSDDNTIEIAKNIAAKSKVSIKIISSPGVGKKSALTEGIQVAESEFILVTDADCVVNSEWISGMVSGFTSEKIVFVAGMVKYSGKGSWLRDILQTEMVFLQVVSAGMYKLGKPIMCNGASMAFRKSFFVKNNGFFGDKYVSGDDIFLLQKANASGVNAIAWNCDSTNLVSTRPASSISEAILQRARWLSKVRGYTGLSGFVTGAMFLAVQLLLPGAIISVFVYGSVSNPIVLSFALKMGVELLLLSLAVPFFGENRIIPKFPLAMVVYNFISIASVFGLMKRDMKWKGRNWKMGRKQ